MLASLLAWYLIKMIRPKIEISENIEKSTFVIAEDIDAIYRIYVRNRCRQNVYDVTLHGRLIIKGLDYDNPGVSRTFIVKIGASSTPGIPPTKKLTIKASLLQLKYPSQQNATTLVSCENYTVNYIMKKINFLLVSKMLLC